MCDIQEDVLIIPTCLLAPKKKREAPFGKKVAEVPERRAAFSAEVRTKTGINSEIKSERERHFTRRQKHKRFT